MILKGSAPNLTVTEIKDTYIQKNFRELQDYFNKQNQLLNFNFVEFQFTGLSVNQKIAHGLGVVPQDVIITRITGDGLVSINWDKFDATNIDVTATDACRIRMFVGSYWKQQSNIPNTGTTSQQVSPSEDASVAGQTIINEITNQTDVTQNISVTNTTTTTTGAASQLNYTAQVLDYNAVINDWVYCSGASFRVTLPTAVGQAGKSIIIQHAGTSLSQIYTLNTVLGQTIGGLASGVFKAYTNGEITILTSDNANWQVTGRSPRTAPATYSPTFSGCTPTSVNVWWSRDGAYIVIGGTLTMAAGLASEFRMPLPGSLIANSVITSQTIVGLLNIGVAAGTAYILSIESGASYLVLTSQASGMGKVFGNGIGGGALMTVTARVPISGFQP